MDSTGLACQRIDSGARAVTASKEAALLRGQPRCGAPRATVDDAAQTLDASARALDAHCPPGNVRATTHPHIRLPRTPHHAKLTRAGHA